MSDSKEKIYINERQQIVIRLDDDLYDDFKATCKRSEMKMTPVLNKLMQDFVRKGGFYKYAKINEEECPKLTKRKLNQEDLD